MWCEWRLVRSDFRVTLWFPVPMGHKVDHRETEEEAEHASFAAAEKNKGGK